MKRITVFTFILLLISFTSLAQNHSELNELKEAYLNIQNDNYKAALPYIERMQRLYPKDPTYNYYLGRCLLFLEKDPSKSTKYLRFASTKDVSNEVYFYLGIAYLRNYQFERAINSFEWFEKTASKKEMEDLYFQNYLSMAQNGQYLTKYVRNPIVIEKEDVEKESFYTKYENDDLKGQFVRADQYFNNEKDSTKEPAIMFLPDNSGKNDVIYYSDINKKRGDYDLYRIARLNDSTWSDPENLGDVINTPFDENYPYMHSDGTSIYFASKGHYSMGGYDLYKSIWNWNTQEWTEPENLDFPVNSPYDDILYVPSLNKRTAYFASNRLSDEDQITIYKIKINSSEPYIELTSSEQVQEYAKLKIAKEPEENTKRNNSAIKYSRIEDELVKIKNDESFIYRSQYDSLLNLAMNYQLKADSLRWVIDDQRLLFEKTKEGQERAILSNKIVEMESKVYSLQKNADKCYEKVREIEQTNLASQKIIYENNNTKEKEVSEDLKNSTNRTNNLFVEPESDTLNKSKLILIEKEEIDSSKLFQYGLEIKLPSSYNSNKPIPLNENLPEGIIYMIQLGAFSSEKSPNVFKGMEPLSCIQKENSKIRKYFAGKFYQLSEAEKNLPVVKSKGFKDAYIVAFQNGKIIPINTAVKMESKEKPIQVYKTEDKKEEKKAQPDLAIIFVLKGHIDINDTIAVQKIKEQLVDSLDFYIEKRNNNTTFIIKSFDSYDKALPMKKNLEAILKKEIEIHAYFAENQIPLDQARKITN